MWTLKDKALPSHSGQQLLDALPEEICTLPFYLVLMSCCSQCLCNTLFNFVTKNHGRIQRRLRQWRRLLRLSRMNYASSTSPPYKSLPTRGRSPSPSRKTVSVSGENSLHRSVDASYNWGCEDGLHDSVVFLAGVQGELCYQQNVPVEVPSPLMEEALADSLEGTRADGQRLCFPFHAMYMTIAALKSLVMAVVIQHHFSAVEGGWRRLCVCGVANVTSGLLTPVTMYAADMLLPFSALRAGKDLVRKEEERKDTVFLVEVIMRVASVDLKDLSTVWIQGATFIIFAAFLLPPFLVFGSVGVVLYGWIFVPLWIAYLVIRYRYYQRDSGHPLSAVQRSGAVLSWGAEFVKVLAVKTLTLMVLQVTVQVGVLLGFALLEGQSYLGALRYALMWETRLPFMNTLSPFQWVCLSSQFIF